MIDIKVNGKKHRLPENWEEVTFSKFLQLIEAKNDYKKILSVLLGLTDEDLKNAKIQGLEIVIRTLSFLTKEPPIDPTPLKLADYIFPQDITFETTEQFEAVRMEISKVSQLDLKAQTEALAFYAAVYIQPLWKNNEYDEEQARYVAKQLLDYPCLEVMSAGSFFQAKCLSMQSGMSMSFLRRNTLLKKKMPGLERSMRRLGFMLHLTPSRGM